MYIHCTTCLVGSISFPACLPKLYFFFVCSQQELNRISIQTFLTPVAFSDRRFITHLASSELCVWVDGWETLITRTNHSGLENTVSALISYCCAVGGAGGCCLISSVLLVNFTCYYLPDKTVYSSLTLSETWESRNLPNDGK